MIPYPLEKGNLFYPYPNCTESADRELLPAFHYVSVYPKKEWPLYIVVVASVCTITAVLAVLTHQYPEAMILCAKTVTEFLSLLLTPLAVILEKIDSLMPTSMWHLLTKI